MPKTMPTSMMDQDQMVTRVMCWENDENNLGEAGASPIFGH